MLSFSTPPSSVITGANIGAIHAREYSPLDDHTYREVSGCNDATQQVRSDGPKRGSPIPPSFSLSPLLLVLRQPIDCCNQLQPRISRASFRSGAVIFQEVLARSISTSAARTRRSASK